MSKTKLITYICIAFLCSGCTLTDQMLKRSIPGTLVKATPELIEATVTIEPWTPTPDYSPTPNSFETLMAAEKENNEQQLLIVNKRLEAANIESENIAENKTQTTRKETFEAGMVIATGTQLAMVGTNDQAARDFQMQLPTIVYAGTQAMYAGPKAQSEIAFNLMFGTTFIVIAFVVVLARISAMKPQTVQETVQETAQEARAVTKTAKKEPTPLPFAPVERTGEYLSPPGNHSHFLIFLMAIFSGKKGFSKPEWETADSPYNRQTYSVVYNWLFQHKFIELPPGGKLRFTKDGEGWAVGWMERNLLLSPEEDDPTYSQLSSGNSQAREIQGPEKGGEVGGGISEDEEQGEDTYVH